MPMMSVAELLERLGTPRDSLNGTIEAALETYRQKLMAGAAAAETSA